MIASVVVRVASISRPVTQRPRGLLDKGRVAVQSSSLFPFSVMVLCPRSDTALRNYLQVSAVRFI